MGIEGLKQICSFAGQKLINTVYNEWGKPVLLLV